MASVRSKIIHSIQDRLGVSFKNSTLIHEAFKAAGTACKSRYATSTSGTNQLSTFANFTYVVEQIENRLPHCQAILSLTLMATTIVAIVGGVFLEKSWDRASSRRIVDALGLAWPDS
ncbi:hypothetical protein ASPFODRAFT_212936 [Aspergillus luchuensis CBS 106.47]|uniref:Uncharacterized protein n=1 Tax=Aspergillus luchuensis (strain CBS 106.47) TaxID=1137211 RepID=A0A1M3SZT8_ASPLC|nr:hypothetical protein ASPFODRAFT_212936 [Aspergillus luchuensis CBS 106.47]